MSSSAALSHYTTETTYQHATFNLLKLLHRINHPPLKSLTHTPSHLSILKALIKKYPLFIAEADPALLHDVYSDQRFVEKLWLAIERHSNYCFPLRVRDFLQGERFILKRIEIFVNIERVLREKDTEIREKRAGTKQVKVQAQGGKVTPRVATARSTASTRLKNHFEGMPQNLPQGEKATKKATKKKSSITHKDPAYDAKGAETQNTLRKYKLKETDDIRRQRQHNDTLDEALNTLDRYTEKLNQLENRMGERLQNLDSKLHSIDSKFASEREALQEEDFENAMFGEEANEFTEAFDEMKRVDQERLAGRVKSSTRKIPPMRKPLIPLEDSEINELISTVRHNLQETNAFISYCKDNTLSTPAPRR